jgi:hypothetical protein
MEQSVPIIIPIIFPIIIIIILLVGANMFVGKCDLCGAVGPPHPNA